MSASQIKQLADIFLIQKNKMFQKKTEFLLVSWFHHPNSGWTSPPPPATALLGPCKRASDVGPWRNSCNAARRSWAHASGDVAQPVFCWRFFLVGFLEGYYMLLLSLDIAIVISNNMNYNLLWLSILLCYHWLYYVILNIKVVEYQYTEITIQTITPN